MNRFFAVSVVVLVSGVALMAGALWGLDGWSGRSGAPPGAVVSDAVVPPRAVEPVPSGSTAPPGSAAPVRLLRSWDLRRARAYAEGDAAALRRLYVPGSRAGAGDVRLLRSYRRRGLHVTGMRMQLFAVQVVAHTAGRWRVRVTDRLAGAVAVGHGQRIRLPRDQASSHVVTLVRRAGTWQVGSVRG